MVGLNYWYQEIWFSRILTWLFGMVAVIDEHLAPTYQNNVFMRNK